MPARKWVWASAREKVEEVQDAASLSPEGRGSMFHSAAITSALSLSGRVRRLTISFGQTCQKSPLRRSQSRSEEHTSELQSLMRISYAVFCLKTKTQLYNKQTLMLSTHTPSTSITK